MTTAARIRPRQRQREREPLRRRMGRRGPSGAAVTIVIASGVFLYLIRNALPPFVLPLVVAYVCTPVVDWLIRRLRLARWLAGLTVLLVLMSLVALAGWLTVPPLAHEVTRAAGDFRGTVESLLRELFDGRGFEILGQTVDAAHVADRIVLASESWIGSGTPLLQLAALSFAGLFGLILSGVLLAYFLINGPAIARGAFSLIPPSRRDLAARVCRRLDPLLRRYFVGVALVVAYASCVAYIGLGLVLGLRHAMLLAVLTGVLEPLPLVGPAASAVIAGLVALHEAKSAGDVAGYVIYAFALRLSIDQLVGPLVLGRAGFVSPVLVIFCFVVGGVLFGVVGVILAVPVALGVKVTLAELYDESPVRPI